MHFLLVDATNGWAKDDTNSFTMSSCVLSNTSLLDYYCTHNHDKNLPITMNDLNTIEISEKLCGKYNNHQGIIAYVYYAAKYYYSYNADTITVTAWLL